MLWRWNHGKNAMFVEAESFCELEFWIQTLWDVYWQFLGLLDHFGSPQPLQIIFAVRLPTLWPLVDGVQRTSTVWLFRYHGTSRPPRLGEDTHPTQRFHDFYMQQFSEWKLYFHELEIETGKCEWRRDFEARVTRKQHQFWFWDLEWVSVEIDRRWSFQRGE